MPQSSRPRIVPTTPPFNPNASSATQEQIDPMQLVRELLAPPPTVAAPMSTLDRVGKILESVAGGAAVGLSADPGRALQQQIQQQQQMRFQEQQAARERDERLDMLNRQFANQIIGGQLDEQRQVRSEDRSEKRYDRQRKDAMDDYIQKQGIDFDYQIQRDAKQAKLAKEDAILKHTWDLEKQDNQEYQFWYQQNRLENKELFDQKIRLITSGIPAGMANQIANKMFYGEDLTDKEAKTITAATQRAMRVASRGSGGGGGTSGGLTDKQESAFLAARMKDQFVVINVPVIDPATGQQALDGTGKPVFQEQTVEMANAPKDPLSGAIVGLKRIASQGDKLKILADEADGLQALKNPGVRQQLRTGSNPQQRNIQSGEDQAKISHYTQKVSDDLNSGKDAEYVRQQLLLTKQSNPNDSAAIDAVLSQLPKTKATVKSKVKLGTGAQIRKQAQNFK